MIGQHCRGVHRALERNHATTEGDNCLINVECNSKIRCNLTGASEMGEWGLDQLEMPCITLRNPLRILEMRDAGFAGVVTAVSAFESHENITLPNQKNEKNEKNEE